MSRTTLSRADRCREVFGVGPATITRRILAAFDRATPSDIEAGAAWYAEAGELATSLARHLDGDRDQAARIIAALSPRTSWARNVAGATALVIEGPTAARRLGCIGGNVETAARVKRDNVELNGPKTRAFAANIAGDREAVTVDVWACRVASLDEKRLGLTRAYDIVAECYRSAAALRGVDPATMQATTWVVARNGRAA